MKYPDTLVISRPDESGSVDSNTGTYTPSGSATTIYSGKCDAQDVVRGGLAMQGAQLKRIEGDLAIYLKDESSIFDIKVGDVGTLTRASHGQSKEQQVIISKVRIFDGVIEATMSE